MYRNPLIMFTGILILLFSLGADVIGLGDSKGIHWVQLSGTLARILDTLLWDISAFFSRKASDEQDIPLHSKTI